MEAVPTNLPFPTHVCTPVHCALCNALHCPVCLQHAPWEWERFFYRQTVTFQPTLSVVSR